VKEIPDRRREFSAASPIPAAPAPSGAGAAGSPSRVAASSGTGAAATLTGITRHTIPGGDRIVLSFDREVPFTTDRIANPDRVWVDFEGAALSDGAEAQADGVKGFGIAGVRVGHPTPATTRVVLDLAGAPRHSIYPLYGPYRLVIDTEGAVPPPLTHTVVAEPAANVVPSGPTAAPPPASAPARASADATPPPMPKVSPVIALPPSLTKGGDYSLARQLGLGVQRIVIDAGHGGHDPGAHGNGIVEKDLVLDIALRLQTLLAEQPGVEVVLTRDTDVFIPLEERTAIANRAGADLFLSIHANASTRKEARGLETYYLNFASNPEAEAVAARENATSSQSMGHLPELVKAIALNNKLAESREFAGLVQTNMVRRLKQQNKTVRDLGVKQAPFVVLIGAAMPSVLAEISFLTNKTEASLLKQNAYKNRIAQALCDAVLKYQNSLKKVTTVASK
jgi:N-acetylmuramoyl-L-alanine amidase